MPIIYNKRKDEMNEECWITTNNRSSHYCVIAINKETNVFQILSCKMLLNLFMIYDKVQRNWIDYKISVQSPGCPRTHGHAECCFTYQ